jgi:hypothetical protein
MIFASESRMGDASETIRARRAKTYYSFKSAANKITQNNVNCGTCAEKTPASGTACTVNFSNYQDKLLYLVGKNAQVPCATQCTS